jgi:hypothetical protein
MAGSNIDVVRARLDTRTTRFAALTPGIPLVLAVKCTRMNIAILLRFQDWASKFGSGPLDNASALGDTATTVFRANGPAAPVGHKARVGGHATDGNNQPEVFLEHDGQSTGDERLRISKGSTRGNLSANSVHVAAGEKTAGLRNLCCNDDIENTSGNHVLLNGCQCSWSCTSSKYNLKHSLSVDLSAAYVGVASPGFTDVCIARLATNRLGDDRS